MKRREFLLATAGAGVAWTMFANTAHAADEVTVVTFSDDGKRLAKVKLPKVKKKDAEWRKQLSAISYAITRQAGTEEPFTGAYWNLHDSGFFRCVCCDTALFSTATKFDSGTGWPSFYDVIADENVVTGKSRAFGHVESELTCRLCDAHLGDVFDDGPQPTGLRYCIDSCALKFVKVAGVVKKL